MNSRFALTLTAASLVVIATISAFLLWPREEHTAEPPAIPETSENEVAEPEVDLEDTDNDGLKDEYELIFFHDLNKSGDEDGDGLPDALEVRLYGSLEVSGDDDQDGLPDAWEMEHFGHLDYGPDDNPDGDDYTNIIELVRGPWNDPSKFSIHGNKAGNGLQKGELRHAADGKVYREWHYRRAYDAGKVDIPWDEL